MQKMSLFMSNNIKICWRSKFVAEIVLSRPHVGNALNNDLLKNLNSALIEIEEDCNVRALILSGEGSSFCSGADLSWMKDSLHMTEYDNFQDTHILKEVLDRLNSFHVPVSCILHGYIYGGGLGLASCADYVIADKKSVFCFSEARVGLVPALISPYVFRVIGERNARRYFLTAEKFNAATAKDIGIVNDVNESSEINELVEVWINNIVSCGPEAIKESKKLILRLSSADDLLQQQIKNQKLISRLRVSKEGQEGIISFVEKRKPYWIKS